MGWLDLGALLKWPVIMAAIGTSIWLGIRWLRKDAVTVDNALDKIEALEEREKSRKEIDRETKLALERARNRLRRK